MYCGPHSWKRHGARRGGPFGMHADMHASMRQARRDQRATHLKAMRRARRAHREGACASGLWAWWWLVFPLVFWVLPSMGRWDWDGMAGAAGRAAAGWISVSPVTWFVEFFARATGMSVSDAGAILLLAVLVNGAVIAFALLQAPRRA